MMKCVALLKKRRLPLEFTRHLEWPGVVSLTRLFHNGQSNRSDQLFHPNAKQADPLAKRIFATVEERHEQP